MFLMPKANKMGRG